ncbi:hypothetical protein CW731_01530 [Polaribacter sp. ALD11]|uniref:hypothetical protein n=1 Tax=Polaribacter sp. ALD11 TaxID=2058137 RepID=UPI000C3081A6|nr:hypothetical protein [Polaribacter sp. ALD11]AUC84050.1 hypothetical protein CW731_01530 [Polaribacter sp. ALD11]
MIIIKKHILISLFYFLVAASLGVLLRLFPVVAVSANYKYIVHTHSHIALLGWVYVALTSLIFYLFIKKEAVKRYAVVFWCTQITIIGMLVSFPITGYALFSIIFSTLFLICTYWFYALFRKNNACNKASYTYKFINTSLLFMVFSSIGPWVIGIIMNTLGNSSHWYKNAIYFYLHFQYNGWFIFCLLGLFFFFLEKKKIKVQKNSIKKLYILMLLGCICTLFLSFLWIKPPVYIYIIAFIGGFLQIIALFKFYQIINNIKPELSKKLSPFLFQLLKLIYLLFIFKIVLQFVSSIPYFAELISQIIDFVIGYLHLTFLGLVSLSLFVFLYYFKILRLSKIWLIIYLTGFVISEFLIFYKGFCNWQQLSIFDNYHQFLVLVSALIPIALLGIFVQNCKAIFSTQRVLQ